jgi:hypothetical protein
MQNAYFTHWRKMRQCSGLRVLNVVVDRFGIPWTINCAEAVQPSFQRTLQAGIPELEFRDSSIRVLSSGI